MPQRHGAGERDRQHRTERGPGRDAERERCGQRIAQQRLEDHAGRGQGGADQSRRQHPRQAGDEENLRVHVVGERNRPIEDTSEADMRGADERRGQACHNRESAKHERRPYQAPAN